MGKNVVKSSFNENEILNKIKSQYNKRYKKSNIYGDGRAAKRISKILYKLNPNIQKKLTY